MSKINWKRISYELWRLLDDISTQDDACRENDKIFRERVRKITEKRGNYLQSLDGMELHLTLPINKGEDTLAEPEDDSYLSP